MKILLAYSVTKGKNVWNRFKKARTWQMHFPLDPRFVEVVVTNDPDPKGKIKEVGCDCGDGYDTFNLSKMRNRSFDHAKEINADWLMILDSDAVVMNFPTMFPASGFGSGFVFYHWSREKFEDLDFENESRLLRKSWYFMGPNIFETHRFDESYIGFGNEESDFLENQIDLEKTPLGWTDLRAMHIWHGKAWTKIHNEDRFVENYKAIKEKRNETKKGR